MLRRSTAVLLAIAALLASCVSPAKYAEERRHGLLAQFPPGTSRIDVKARWGSAPDVMATRPSDGWASAPNSAVRQHATASETRTGKPVARVERYSGPDFRTSSPLSLCHGWFYFDEADRVVDVDWEYMSD